MDIFNPIKYNQRNSETFLPKIFRLGDERSLDEFENFVTHNKDIVCYIK